MSTHPHRGAGFQFPLPHYPYACPKTGCQQVPNSSTTLRENKEPHTEVGKIGLFVLIKPSEEAKTWAKTKNKTGNSLEKK